MAVPGYDTLEAHLNDARDAAAPVVQDGAVRERRRRRIVLALLGVTLVKQVVQALAYPPFQGHDEVAHLAYLRSVARLHRLPTFADEIPAALSEYARYTLDWPALYTANHPPLYYLVSAPAFLLAGDDYLRQLYFVRLMAVPFFLGVVWLAHRIATTLFPSDDFLALTVPAVVAMQPQLAFEGAVVNNDMLSIFWGALILWLCVLVARDRLGTRQALYLGCACGMGLLTKATLTALLPVVAGIAVWSAWPRPGRRIVTGGWWRATAPRALALGLPTVLLPLPWYFYLRQTYGDFTAFEATRELQRDWNRPAGTFGELAMSMSFHAERLKETWGFYGWKLLPLSDGELLAVQTATVVVGIGLVVGVARLARDVRRGLGPQQAQVAGVAVLAAASLLMYGATVYFGTMFLLTQARYFFPILPAAAVLAMLGLRALIPERARTPAAAGVILAVTAFQVLLLTRLVLPYASA